MEEDYIRISQLTPTESVGLSDLFIVSQFNSLSDTPEEDRYVSRSISSDVLTRCIYGRISAEIEERIAQEIGKIGSIGNIIAQISCISTDLGDAISAILGLDACRIKFKENVYTKEEIANISSYVKTDALSAVDKDYVKKNTLSTETWYMYTDQYPSTPIPFNVVLSVSQT